MDGLDLRTNWSSGDEDRLDRARVCDLEGLVGVVPHRHQHRHILRIQLAFLQLIVERGQQCRRRKMLRSERAENSAYQCRVECSRRRLPADVSYGKSRSAWTVVQEIVDIAPDRAGCKKLRRDLCAFKLGWPGGHQAKLDLSRHLQIALHALLLLVDALVQPRIGNRDGDLRRKRG